MCEQAAIADTNAGAPQIEVTPEMLSDFCDVLSDFEVWPMIPERFLDCVLQALAPHLAKQNLGTCSKL